MISVETLEDAIVFAVNKHRGQKRKGNGRPYIMHPMSVMRRICDTKKSSNMFLLAAAAILHDTVEDCGVGFEEIEERFGFHVAVLVKELTTDKSESKDLGKSEYLAQKMLKMSSYALAIKLCDRLDNICEMESMSPEFKRRYRKETLYILDKIKSRNLTPAHKRLIREIYAQL